MNSPLKRVKSPTNIKRFSFSQREGIENLPTPMKIKEISWELRVEIWNLFYEYFVKNCYPVCTTIVGTEYSLNDEAKAFLQRVLGKYFTLPHDEINLEYEEVIPRFKDIILNEKFNNVLDLLEFVANDQRYQNPQFSKKFSNLFEEHGAAYRITNEFPFNFFPITSPEQGNAIKVSFEILNQNKMNGSVKHLRKAIQHINEHNWEDSIAQSIHAVESVARLIDPKDSKTLGPALKSLRSAGLLTHGALCEGFNKLYGYTCDENGIRHAFNNEDSKNVDLAEALYMFGSCASFSGYLAMKQKELKARVTREVKG